jgi:hypothetical protein
MQASAVNKAVHSDLLGQLLTLENQLGVRTVQLFTQCVSEDQAQASTKWRTHIRVHAGFDDGASEEVPAVRQPPRRRGRQTPCAYACLGRGAGAEYVGTSCSGSLYLDIDGSAALWPQPKVWPKASRPTSTPDLPLFYELPSMRLRDWKKRLKRVIADRQEGVRTTAAGVCSSKRGEDRIAGSMSKEGGRANATGERGSVVARKYSGRG